jgi:hypothetical protein
MRTTRWMGAFVGALAVAAIVSSCSGTGGGGGGDGGGTTPEPQFILNSNNSGRLSLNVNPATVDANKSDRIGLVAVLTDSLGHGVSGVPVTFTSEIDDIEFLPDQVDDNGHHFGVAVTDANGRADILAISGATPTGTGDIIGTGAIFATAPTAFGLRAQVQVTLTDVGFIDADQLAVIPSSVDLVEPAPGQVIFFTVVGGRPPYFLTNEVSGIGTAAIGQRCLPGCTENGGILCIGSPCQSDEDCNLNGASSPAGVCLGPIRHCIASCQGTNCSGARCEIDADCNDGAASPANVCQDSGQAIAYIINADPAAGSHVFTVHDSEGTAVNVTVNVSFVCGNGVARGDEQCDLGDFRGATCESLGRPAGALTCSDTCTFDVTGCTGASASPGGGGATPTAGGPTATAATPTTTPTPGAGTPTAAGTPGVGIPSNLTLALLTNGSGINGNGTLTTVISATVTDSIGNAVPDNTQVLFGLSGGTQGAIISSPAGTNADAPCDVSSFESSSQGTGITVFNEPGVAHTCVTYPVASAGAQITINGVSGAASDSQAFTLPPPPGP